MKLYYRLSIPRNLNLKSNFFFELSLVRNPTNQKRAYLFFVFWIFWWNFTIGYQYLRIRIWNRIFPLSYHWPETRPIEWWDPEIDQVYWSTLKSISQMREPSKLMNWLRHSGKFSLSNSNTSIHGSLRLNLCTNGLIQVCEVKHILRKV